MFSDGNCLGIHEFISGSMPSYALKSSGGLGTTLFINMLSKN